MPGCGTRGLVRDHRKWRRASYLDRAAKINGDRLRESKANVTARSKTPAAGAGDIKRYRMDASIRTSSISCSPASYIMHSDALCLPLTPSAPRRSSAIYTIRSQRHLFTMIINFVARLADLPDRSHRTQKPFQRRIEW